MPLQPSLRTPARLLRVTALRASCSLLLGLLTPAFTLAQAPLELRWVTVGDPGNPPDTTGHGAVPYPFQIGQFEVTVGEYATFLNAVATSDPHHLWKPAMAEAGLVPRHTTVLQRTGEKGAYRYHALPGTEHFPIIFVTLADAMRFANWLHNGQGQADTESGAYDLTGDPLPVRRSAGARFWIPNEDEWYKAAYHHPMSQGGPSAGYWSYPTQTHEVPRLERHGGTTPHSASFLDAAFQGDNHAFLIPVGSHPNSPSHYGTFDQGGSVWEWTETPRGDAQRILRGGSVTRPVAALRSVMRFGIRPDTSERDFGFRVARSLPTPNPPNATARADSPRTSPTRPSSTLLAEAHRLFEDACTECHDSDTRKGGLDLTNLPWTPQLRENALTWTRILDKITHGEMPPPKRERPAESLVQAFTQPLRAELHEANLQRQQQEGRVVLRRLNRREYLHTIQDLFDVHIPLEDLLPPDATESGFDNIGGALQLSAAHLERYMEAADKVLREATFLRPRPPTKRIRTDLSELWLNKLERQQTLWSFSPEGYLAIRAHRGNGGRTLDWRPEIPNALYRLHVRTRAMLDDAGESGGTGKALNRSSPATQGQAGLRIFNLWPKPGGDPRITVALGVAREGASGTLEKARYYETSPTEFRSLVYEARVPAGYSFQIAPYRIIADEPGEEGGKFHGMCAVIESLLIEGPLFEEWPPRGHRLMYGDLPLQQTKARANGSTFQLASADPELDARRILTSALPKLFRRPVSEADLEEYIGLCLERLRAQVPLDAALREAFKMALCSPDFLFFHETPGRLDDFALASRLSYALWSSTPDDELLDLSARKQLHDPKVLRQQTHRLLEDPRASRFAKHFLESWLNLREIDATQPDSKLFTEFEAQLQDAMLAESEAFWMTLVRENLPAHNVIHSDFAMLNERLAEHYGIPGVRGDELRRVLLPPTSHRGGFLTQGAVLKVSANGTVTSPVVRGAYVLDRFLGRPPEPPPKSVPAIEPDIRGATTIRTQLEKHRNDAACAVCHSKIDPPGFALESYDVTGRWRSHYRVLSEENRKKTVTLPGAPYRLFREGPAVHPGATTAEGRVFEDVEGFKRGLLEQPVPIARCVLQKLTAHLTGATPQFADREVIEDILANTESERFGVRSLIHGIIQSRLFTHK